MKLIISITFLGLSLFIYMFWLAGSHGQVRIRTQMAEDWVLAGGIIGCLFTSILFFILWLRKRKKDRS